MNRNNSVDYTIRSTELAFEILNMLSVQDTFNKNMPFIADKLNISRNNAYRLLSTLEKNSFVVKDNISGCYRLGISAIELSCKIIKSTSIISYAHPVIENLAKKHDEAVYMTVINGNDVVFLDMVDCDQSIKATPLIGRRFPLFSIAAGKVLKALESRDLIEKHYCKKNSNGTNEEFKTLETELKDIREKGVAVDNGKLGEGISSVAVAVKDYAGKVIGAITLLGPSFRMLAERVENEIIPSLKEGAEMLSAKFGYSRG